MSSLWRLGVVSLCIAALIGIAAHFRPEVAVGSDEAPTTPPVVEVKSPLPQRDHFKLYPADPGAQSYEDLSPIEKQVIDGMKAYMSSPKHGAAVHQVWSQGTATRLRYHQLKVAQRQAGLEGVVNLGVK